MNLDYGRCVGCGRIMPLRSKKGKKFLKQIRYYEGHLYHGSYHHKLLCLSCEQAANDIFGKEK